MKNARRYLWFGMVLTIAVVAMIVVGCAAPTPTPTQPPAQPAAPQATTAPAPTNPPAPAAQEQRKPVKIYLVAHGACSWDAFWCIVEQGNKDAARDLGVDLTIISPPKFDPERTASDIDRALAAKPDALGVTVTDGAMYQEPMLRAIKTGIPVIAYNSADQRPADKRIPYLTYIGQDEYQGGYIAGRRMAALGKGHKGVCVNQAVGHTGLDARCKGFADALAEKGIKSQVLAISNDAAEAAKTMGDFYAANRDVDMWLTLGPNGANPFYAFMKNAGLKSGDIIHATFDLSPEIAARIKDGTTLLATDQQPYVQGYLVVQWLTWIVRYSLYPPTAITATGPGVTDLKNVDTVLQLAGKYR
jgi:simple sugar transport system substrate-binding protein